MTWITTHTKKVKGRDGAADAVTHWPAVRAGGRVCSKIGGNAPCTRFLQCGFRCNVLPLGLEVHCIAMLLIRAALQCGANGRHPPLPHVGGRGYGRVGSGEFTLGNSPQTANNNEYYINLQIENWK